MRISAGAKLQKSAVQICEYLRDQISREIIKNAGYKPGILLLK